MTRSFSSNNTIRPGPGRRNAPRAQPRRSVIQNNSSQLHGLRAGQLIRLRRIAQRSVHSVQHRNHLLHLPLSLHSTSLPTPTSITFRCAMRLGDSGESGSAEREDIDGMALGVSEKFSMRRFTSSISSLRSTCVGLRWKQELENTPRRAWRTRCELAEADRSCRGWFLGGRGCRHADGCEARWE